MVADILTVVMLSDQKSGCYVRAGERYITCEVTERREQRNDQRSIPIRTHTMWSLNYTLCVVTDKYKRVWFLFPG